MWDLGNFFNKMDEEKLLKILKKDSGVNFEKTQLKNKWNQQKAKKKE